MSCFEIIFIKQNNYEKASRSANKDIAALFFFTLFSSTVFEMTPYNTLSSSLLVKIVMLKLMEIKNYLPE